MSEVIDRFPDGTPVDAWFHAAEEPVRYEPGMFGSVYDVTQHGVLDDGRVHTAELQALIERIAAEPKGGVVLVPPGVYLTGAIWLRQGVTLFIQRGGMLRGSDDPADYPVCETRIEGESCRYFPALINAEGLHDVFILGEGTIDGNGLRSWRSFWQRRDWNPRCTNKDEQRARLIFMANCSHVLVSGLNLQNAQFWTNHLYKCGHVRYADCRIYSPASPVKAPSTDAIDIDACHDVHIKRCTMEVNDDAVALKGGKGPWADTQPENGGNERIIIEDCTYGFCHGCLTCGSESIRNHNIIMRRIRVSSGYNLLWLKMRPDTPQHYAYITVEDVSGGEVENIINVSPWTQFFDLKGRTDMPVSVADHVTLRGIRMNCENCFNIVPKDDQYLLRDFTFEDMHIAARHVCLDPKTLPGAVVTDVHVGGAETYTTEEGEDIECEVISTAYSSSRK